MHTAAAGACLQAWLMQGKGVRFTVAHLQSLVRIPPQRHSAAAAAAGRRRHCHLPPADSAFCMSCDTSGACIEAGNKRPRDAGP